MADSLAKARAWWLRRQGLMPAMAPKTIEACVRQAGWLPTSGSVGAYLSVRARMPGTSREAIDRVALDGVSLIEVAGSLGRPSVLVPLDEKALALRLHWSTYQRHIAPHIANGSLSEAALRGVGAQVCRVLDEGPLPTAEIRKGVAHPDAGELLASALIDLTVRGIVHRFPQDGRLDSSKYMYELRHPDDRPNLEAEGDEDSVVAKAAAHFLAHHGPATVAELSWWGVLTKGAARKALAALGAESFAVQGWTKEAWLLPADVKAWRSFKGEAGDRVVLLPNRDPYVHWRRGPLVLARSASAVVLDPALKRAPIADVETLNHHTILSGADLVGVWEFDPDAGRIVTRLWDGNTGLRRRVADAAADTERFVRDQLGDAKLSNVDPPPKRAKRLAFCRAK